MTYSRTIKLTCALTASALVAMGQTRAPRAAAAPSPPDVWEQAPAPTPAVAPRPVVRAWAAPMPAPAPVAVVAGDWDQIPAPPAPPTPAVAPVAPAPPAPAIAISPFAYVDVDAIREQAMEAAQMARDNFQLDADIQDQIQRSKEMAQGLKFDTSEVRAQAMAAVKDTMSGMKFAFAPQVGQGVGIGVGGKMPPMPPTPPTPAGMRRLMNMSDDRLYSAGQSSLDNRQWEQAVEYFSQVVAKGSPRADGALYWKAYALGRLGKRDDGLAAIAELRKSYASSRWLDDAKALELELKQASGQTVSPESESDEELKLMAINGLMQTDPERAMPLLEKQLKGSASPRVKRNALFVLAQSSSPKAQTMIEQIARGGANPDLQVKAITYMTERRRTGNAQILAEIYSSTTDVQVKRAVLQAYMSNRDKDRILQAAKTEKAPELREMAISYLGESQGNPELWQMYQSETTSEGKILLLRYMHSNSDPDKLLEVVRNDKDPKVRVAAMHALASHRSATAGDKLAAVYNTEQDPQVKQSILDSLMSQGNAKALVDIARGEKDTKLKLRIVQRLSNMKAKEAQDYLQEILSK